MINQQLTDWVQEQLRQGTSKDEVRQMLKNSDWQDSDINEALSSTGPSSTFNSPPPTPTNIQLIGPWDLLKKSLSVYKNRFWTLLGIYFLPMIIVAIPLIAIVGIVTTIGLLIKGVTAIILGIVLFIIFIVLFINFVGWVPSALLYAIKDRDEKIGIKESYRRSRHIKISMLWVMIVSSFVLYGGMLLLIIPGIIFLVWFLFSSYILVSEETKGMDALMKSKEYVRGRWWGVLGRLIFIQIMIYASIFIIPWIFSFFNTTLSSIVAFIISILSTPIQFIAGFLMYENLREIKGPNIVVASKKGLFIFLAWLGVLIIPISIMATVVLVSLGSARATSRDLIRAVDLNNLQLSTESYFNDNHHYPTSMQDLLPSYYPKELPADPLTHAPYKYTVAPARDIYTICAETEKKGEQCLSQLP